MSALKLFWRHLEDIMAHYHESDDCSELLPVWSQVAGFACNMTKANSFKGYSYYYIKFVIFNTYTRPILALQNPLSSVLPNEIYGQQLPYP